MGCFLLCRIYCIFVAEIAWLGNRRGDRTIVDTFDLRRALNIRYPIAFRVQFPAPSVQKMHG